MLGINKRDPDPGNQNIIIPGELLNRPLGVNFTAAVEQLKEIILVCRSGARACTAQKILAQNGIVNTTVLDGGVMNLNPNKYPLESGMKKIGLEKDK